MLLFAHGIESLVVSLAGFGTIYYLLTLLAVFLKYCEREGRPLQFGIAHVCVAIALIAPLLLLWSLILRQYF